MTKAITGAAAMQLVEQGKLELDEPIGEVLPELGEVAGARQASTPTASRAAPAQAADHAAPSADPHRRLRLRHLERRHRALPDRRRACPGITSCKNAALTTPLLFDPGERWEYGINIDWAGKVVEAVSGQKLERVSARATLRAAGHDRHRLLHRRRRCASSPGRSMHARRRTARSSRSSSRCRRSRSSSWAAAASTARPRDYLAFLQMMLHGGELDGGAQCCGRRPWRRCAKNDMGD